VTASFRAVLDASAVLAVLHREPGYTQVVPHLDQAVISSVNWAEVVQKALSRNILLESLVAEFPFLRVSIEPFTAEDAEASGILWTETRRWGLSLADRACLSLALRHGLPVITADRVWSSVQAGVTIHVIR